MGNKDVDYLIVGQGIAGTLVSHFLKKNNQSFLIIDKAIRNSSSKLAAGIINPITGRRFVKSWMFDELFPFAEKTYLELEEKLDTKFLYRHSIKRALFSQKEENDWDLRSLDDEYIPYIKEIPSEDIQINNCLSKPYSWGEIIGSGRMEMPLLIKKYKEHLEELNQIVLDNVGYDEFKNRDGYVQYKNISAKKVIFCEGIGTLKNPYFNYLPFVPSKGDVLFIKINDCDFDKIVKHKIFIVPQGNQIYWIGSTYDWDYIDDNPSINQADKLIEKLKQVLNVPFEIVDHRAAIRPTVKDRRPFIGFHPEHENFVIFNGLGTKGATLGPYWANHLVNVLVNKEQLSAEVNIARFTLSNNL